MLQTCGVDYNVDKSWVCRQDFDDAERMTSCPHPLLGDPTWAAQIIAWEKSGDACSVCNSTGTLYSVGLLSGVPFRCYVCHGTGKKPPPRGLPSNVADEYLDSQREVWAS